jgi:hypothetical protein
MAKIDRVMGLGYRCSRSMVLDTVVFQYVVAFVG